MDVVVRRGHYAWRAFALILATVCGINAFFPSYDFASDNKKQGNSLKRSGKESDANNAVLMICDEAYCGAVASLIASVRRDGGYVGDIAVVVEPSQNFTKDSLKADIYRENVKANVSEPLADIHIWSSDELFDTLHLNGNSYLRNTPPLASCLQNYPRTKHRAYYLKSLIFHPVFTKWTTVLFMDACMTIHSPHIHELFDRPELEKHLLPSPDPWFWGRRGISAKFVKECPDPNATHIVQKIVQRRDLTKVRYFASGLILHDTSIILDHGTSPQDTIIEILSLYHKLAVLFLGDQEILSLYWVYKRDEFRVMPLAMLESNRVPYEFVKRIPGDPHVITAGHKTRKVCKSRATNSRTT